MVVRRKKIVVDGQEIEIPVFDTKINPGKAVDTDTLDKIRKEEEIEKEIQKSLERIRAVRGKYKTIQKNIAYFYDVGKILHFVDRKDFVSQKARIWQRIARDLGPELFLFGEEQNPKEARRYPEYMYYLSKIPKKFLKRASWNQWYEIVKFKNIYKNQRFLGKVLDECKSGSSGQSLRDKIKSILKSK